jgi:hypothetical protein
MISKRVSPWPATGPRLVAALAGLLGLSISLHGLPAAAQPPEPEAKAVVARLIDVIKDKRANREQRINACVVLSKPEYRKESADAIGPMVSFLEELIQEVPAGWSPYHPIVGPGLDQVAVAVGEVVAAAEDPNKAKAAVPVLISILKRPWVMQSDKRRAAVEALGKIGSTDAASALIEASRQDRSATGPKSVRAAVVTAMQEIATKHPDTDEGKKLAAELKAISEIDKAREAGGAAAKKAADNKPEDKAVDKKPEDKVPDKKEDKEKKPEDKGDKKDGDKKNGDKKPDEAFRPEKLPSPRAGR